MPPFPIARSYSCWQRRLGLLFVAREGATLLLAASNARFVAREDALRLHVRAGSEAKDRIETCKLGSEVKIIVKIIAAHLLSRRL